MAEADCSADELPFDKLEDGDDTDISQEVVQTAVKFLLDKSQDGTVALCIGIAELIQQNMNLKVELDLLKKGRNYFKKRHRTSSRISSGSSSSQTNFTSSSDVNSEIAAIMLETTNESICKESELSDEETTDHIGIRGCMCKKCDTCDSMFKIEPLLHNGEKVIIVGEMSGTVRYFGHIAYTDTSTIYVGLQMDAAYGGTDGVFEGIRYFICPKRYGKFVSLDHILCPFR